MIDIDSKPRTTVAEGHVRNILAPADDGTRVRVAIVEVEAGRTHALTASERTPVAYRRIGVLQPGMDPSRLRAGRARRRRERGTVYPGNPEIVLAPGGMNDQRHRQRDTVSDNSRRRNIRGARIVGAIAGDLRRRRFMRRRMPTMMIVVAGRGGTVVHRALQRGGARMPMFGAPADAQSAGRERTDLDAHGCQRYRQNVDPNTAHAGGAISDGRPSPGPTAPVCRQASARPRP